MGEACSESTAQQSPLPPLVVFTLWLCPFLRNADCQYGVWLVFISAAKDDLNFTVKRVDVRIRLGAKLIPGFDTHP